MIRLRGEKNKKKVVSIRPASKGSAEGKQFVRPWSLA